MRGFFYNVRQKIKGRALRPNRHQVESFCALKFILFVTGLFFRNRIKNLQVSSQLFFCSDKIMTAVISAFDFFDPGILSIASAAWIASFRQERAAR